MLEAQQGGAYRLNSRHRGCRGASRLGANRPGHVDAVEPDQFVAVFVFREGHVEGRSQGCQGVPVAKIHIALLRSQGEASLDGILSVARNGSILFCNRRFSELWGVDASAGERFENVLERMAARVNEPLDVFVRRAAVHEREERSDEVVLSDDRVLDFRSLAWVSAQQLGLGAPMLRARPR